MLRSTFIHVLEYTYVKLETSQGHRVKSSAENIFFSFQIRLSSPHPPAVKSNGNTFQNFHAPYLFSFRKVDIKGSTSARHKKQLSRDIDIISSPTSFSTLP